MINKYKKTAKKGGEMELGNLYEVGLRKIMRLSLVRFSPKLKVVGLIIFAMAAVWFVLPASGAEAVNRYRVGTGDWNTTASWSATSGGVGGEL